MVLLLAVGAMASVAAVVEAGARGRTGEPVVQIDATGSVLAAARAAQQRQQRASGKNQIVRQAVRPHVAEKAAAGVAPKRTGLLDEGTSLECASELELHEPLASNLCKILVGSNSHVAGKLERAVKGLSLRPKSTNDIEMKVADQAEEKTLIQLKGALWNLWFCAKRSQPPCNPLTSTERSVSRARDEAINALRSINKHPKADSTERADVPKVDVEAAAQRSDHRPGGSVMPAPQEPEQSMSPMGWSAAHGHESLMEKVLSLLQLDSSSGLHNATAADSEFARTTMSRILQGSKQDVMGKLWKAIHRMDIQNVIQSDIVRIEDDEDKNFQKMMNAMLVLHSCATQPQCPDDATKKSGTDSTKCCTPRSSEDEAIRKARDDAYIAFHNIGADTRMGAIAYKDLLRTVSDQKTFPGGPHVTTTHESHTTTEEEEEETTTLNTTNATNSTQPAKVEEEGSIMLIAICVVTVVVLLMIAYLMYVANKMNDDDPAPAKTAEAYGGQEDWGGEYGNY